MKQISILFISWLLAAFSYKAMAQDDIKIKEKSGDKVTEKKKTEEIVIRKKGNKDINLNIQITGDKIMVNGKPLIEFNDDNIIIHKRNITVFEGDRLAMLNNMGDRFGNMEMENFGFDFNSGSKVVLGVTTSKADNGAMITNVTKGSAAEKAGLLKDDIILRFGDKKIDDSQDLFDAVNEKKPNEEVKIDYMRGGSNKSVKVKLNERKAQSFGMTSPNGMYKSYTLPRKPAPAVRGRNFDQLYGLDDQINGAMDYAFAFGKQRLGLKIQDTEDESGVKILSIEDNSTSANAGLQKGDVITQIADKKIKNTDEAREALHENDSKQNYALKARRNGKEMSFDIKIPKKLKTTSL